MASKKKTKRLLKAERLKILETLLHDMHQARWLFNHEAIMVYLDRISAWSRAHTNSRMYPESEKEENARIDAITRKLIEPIVRTESK